MSKKTRWIITITNNLESPGDDWEPFAVRHEYGETQWDDREDGYVTDEYSYVYWKKKVEIEEE